MRTIKFRAWNTKGMIHSGATDLKFYLEGNTGKAYTLERDKYNEWGMSPVDWILMQYTGLVDRNGVGIYEADIVKTLDGYLALVSWDDEHTGFDPFGSQEGAEWGDGVEVIGNLWENPELLEPKS